MKRNRMSSKTTKLLREQEYNFESVSNDEIDLCFLYEYGRSADGFKKLVAEWRAAHPKILAAARSLLKRSGPFSFTCGPTAENRMEAALFARNNTLTEADKKKAGENGKAWSKWLQTSWKGGNPGGFPLDDPRVFLFYCPAFPNTPWQTLSLEYRQRVRLLHSDLVAGGRLHAWLALANRELTEAVKAQADMQAACHMPMDQQTLLASVRGQIEEFLFAPGLIELAEGIRRGLVGFLPPSFRYGNRPRQFCADGFCHEEVTFVINWAKPDKEIGESLKRWLKTPGNRPHKDFKTSSVTSAREHLQKLGAWRVLQSGSTAEHACDTDPRTGKRYFALRYQNPDQVLRGKSQAAYVLKNLFPSPDT